MRIEGVPDTTSQDTSEHLQGRTMYIQIDRDSKGTVRCHAVSIHFVVSTHHPYRFVDHNKCTCVQKAAAMLAVESNYVILKYLVIVKRKEKKKKKNLGAYMCSCCDERPYYPLYLLCREAFRDQKL